MTLVKQSERTLRLGCKRCGRTSVYWAKDDETNRFVLIDARDLAKSASKGGKVPSDYLHTCGTDAKPVEQTEAPAEDRPATVKFEIMPEPPKPGPVVKQPAAPVATGSEAQALDALRTLLGSPAVDAAQVREIVKSELDSVVFPTRTIVVTPQGDRKPIEGATHSKLADVTTNILAGEHVLMVGPAGTGKSTIAEQTAEALGLPFYAISLSPQTSSAQIIGYKQATGDYVSTLFREAYESGGLFHFDEFDNGHPSVLALVNAALANGHMAFPDGMVKRHADFRVIASANTYGRGPDRQYVGRQALDAATLDRFSVETIDIDTALERQLCVATGLDSSKVLGILSYVYKLRDNAEEHRLPVVISPRASVGACRLLAAGRPWDAIVDARMRRGLSDADWSKLSAGAPKVA